LILVILRDRSLDVQVQTRLMAIRASDVNALVKLFLSFIIDRRRHRRGELVGNEFLLRNFVVDLLQSAAIATACEIHAKA